MASNGIGEKRLDVRYATDLSLSNEVISTTHNFNTLSHPDLFPSLDDSILPQK
jgi:hypothetical protein